MRRLAPRPLRVHRVLPLAVLALLTVLPALLHAQGCTQCRDNTAATPPATQHAYRSAILLLGLTGVGICSAAVLVARRFR